jgi:glycerate-2-kinase
VAAADEALAFAHGLGPDDRLLVLLSGGASALWSAPVAAVSLEDKQVLTDALLRAGVDIARINAVRKHLSRIKGGRLVEAAHPAAVWTLAVSDVAGDPPDAIGSGPTSPDPTTFADAIDVLESAGLSRSVPAAVLQHLRAGVEGREPDTPKPGASIFERCRFEVVANLERALACVDEAARERGLRVRTLGRILDAEVGDCARVLAEELQRASEQNVQLLVAGGEPTVTVRGDGLGGRAQELALAFALAAQGREYSALFAGTDGTDGPTQAAGAFVDSTTLERVAAAGVDARGSLERNDSHRVFAASGDLLITGPTHTNVNDIGLIWTGEG